MKKNEKEIKYLDKWIPEYDIVKNDIIRFSEPIFEVVRGKVTYQGNRYIEAFVMNDSYGKKKMQHTFSLKIINSDYFTFGSVIRRKGRNIYKREPERKLWEDENLRNLYILDKRERKEKTKQLVEKTKEKLIWQF